MEETRWNAIRDQLLALTQDEDSGVVGFVNDLADETTGGRPTGRQAIVVLVKHKKPPGELDAAHLLPEEIDGIPVDVEPFGTVTLAGDAATEVVEGTVTGTPEPRLPVRPLIGGISSACATPANDYGTLGYFVKDFAGSWYALSCAHVYAPGVATSGSSAECDPRILQPSPGDGGTAPVDQIGNVSSAVFDSSLDAAIADLDVEAMASLTLFPPPVGITKAAPKMYVCKCGRSTNKTFGIVSYDSITVTDVQMLGGKYTFTDVMAIKSQDWQNGTDFAASGDSGSLVVTQSPSPLAIGLLMGDSEPQPVEHNTDNPEMFRYTVACHIGKVLDKLKVSLVLPTDPFK